MKAPAKGARPGVKWRIVRAICLAAAPIAILLAPLLGGWQRMDRNYLAAWDGHGWDIPAWLLAELPMGEAPKLAHESNLLRGGGSGLEYFGLSLMDPVSGGLAISSDPSTSVLVWLAWGLPVLLALFLGRVFCGWFCPFGLLARASETLIDFLPFRVPRFVMPQRRWLRFVILAVGGLAGALFGSGLIYFFLPYVLLQSSVYSMWLMGGGGASLGALCGLLLAGMIFGPTTYCTTLCPTGAALGLLGSRKAVHLTILEPANCGARCDLCDHACWLSLAPSTGEPGFDCDLCGRCAEICPQANLGLARRPRPRTRAGKPTVSLPLALLLCLVGGGLSSSVAQAANQRRGGNGDEPAWMRPRARLVIEEHRRVGEVDVWVSVKDFNGVRREVDSDVARTGIEVSVYLAQGAPGAVSARGKQSPREQVYTGPLTVEVRADGKADAVLIHFDKPTHPISTPHRSIYRRHLDVNLVPGGAVQLPAIAGWLDAPVQVEVARDNNELTPARWAGNAGAAFAFFSGLLLLSLVGRKPAQA